MPQLHQGQKDWLSCYWGRCKEFHPSVLPLLTVPHAENTTCDTRMQSPRSIPIAQSIYILHLNFFYFSSKESVKECLRINVHTVHSLLAQSSQEGL